ncbi:hypothetical protein Ddye_000504 [Dipteronia dyeriana]|uniref:Uncharacterized protein n=1 Tax=Dipteronia dyeriana TaxID=168575 RepID=A0AAE0CSF6_9ROSI|nr:hypothetical protein Ddye_000504 [Dipteronia dyeriana]
MTNRLKELLKTPEEEWYEGKLTHHDHFDAIGAIDDTLNHVLAKIVVEDRRRFMASCFEHFMTMHRRMKFSSGVIHRLPLREVHHTGPSDEMHFLLGNQEVRFSKVEFCLIIGLRFREVPDMSRYDRVDILIGLDESEDSSLAVLSGGGSRCFRRILVGCPRVQSFNILIQACA